MSSTNYRGTGKSKAECQAQVDVAIARFKKDRPGKPVPISLMRWVDNIATKADCKIALSRLNAQHIKHLNKGD